LITLDGVGVRYGTACALAGVSEQVPAGQWLGVIGPNGAGKTTLLRSIACLLPHAGTITIGGQPTSGLRRRRLARLVAYVPQLPELPPEMTVGDYVLLGRTPHIGYLRMETAADRQICAGLLDRLGLSPMAGRTLDTLSGGEMQRIVLARALAQQAPVLLLDEPTSALDLGRRVDALELIDELRRERSLTVLSAVHDLTLAGQFADRLLLLAGGQVAAAGTARTVLRTDVLGPVFGPGVEVLADSGGAPVVISQRRGPVAAPPSPAVTPPSPAVTPPAPATPPSPAVTPPGPGHSP
jgi:iron complex transport system ATP-binding protein